MKALDDRLKAAWVALEAAASKSDRQFWATFDEIEAQILDGLGGTDLAKATEALHAYLAKIRGFDGNRKRPPNS